MSRRHRLALILALLLVVPFAACGTAEEPAQNAEPPAEEPVEAPAEEPAAMEPDTPAMEEPADAAPQAPELVGNIRLSGEDLEWTSSTQDSASYRWTVRVNNDTTATLDITVRFQLLDDSDGVVKTERSTVRLQPAQSTTINESGSMSFDDANRVYSYASTFDYEIVQS